MSILDRFEQRVDRLVHGALEKARDAEVEPVEVASALQTEIDETVTTIGAGRTIVANVYSIEFSPVDYERMMSVHVPLRTELAALAQEHINSQRFSTVGEIQVSFALDSDLTTGVFRIVPSRVDEEGARVDDVHSALTRKGPHVIVNGYSHTLTLQRTVFGRGTEADVRIDDAGISRKHFEIVLSNPPVLRDLNSTNGTFILGDRITEVALKADVDIKAGNTLMQFRLR